LEDKLLLVCPCCGLPFDKDKMHGPFRSGPYNYVCDQCWNKPYLYFPDKKVDADLIGLFGTTGYQAKPQKTILIKTLILEATNSMRGENNMEKDIAIVELAITPERKTRCEIKDVPLSELKLDPNNVRFKHEEKQMTDPEIEAYIWKQPETKSLYREILASRGLSEPPIIDAKNFVKEGNRRLVCLRKLSANAHKGELPADIAKDKFDNVQSYVLPPDTPDKDIGIYLARVHVSGKDMWRTLNKAAQIYELYHKHGMTLDDLKDYLGMGKASVVTILETFEKTKDYGSKYPKDKEWIAKYSYFYEVYKKKNLKEWAEKEKNTERLMKWIAEDKIPTGADIRLLDKMITNEDALKALDTKGISGALAVIEKEDPAIKSSVYKVVRQAINTLNTIPLDEFTVTAKDNARLKMLKELRSSIDKILKNVETLKLEAS
jgi:hypothetical protein